MTKPLYEINLKEFRKNYDYGDLSMLEYIKDYIPSYLESLYKDVLNYNEIYANGWTIKDLLVMGEKEEYWKVRAENFIKKYNVPEKDYREHLKYYNKYIELRDNLLEQLDLDEFILEDFDINLLGEKGYVAGENYTYPGYKEYAGSSSVARLSNYAYSIELFYNEGKAKIEYGYRIDLNNWKKETEEIDWFNPDMDQEKIMDRLYEQFKNHFSKNKSVIEENKDEMEVEQN
ncbi:MAG: hypothetical protein IJ565_05905 [Bacilli bacterium]|nr:hypothetical protein [Bacilli bacterium]